jgi:hypothetical protein
MLNMMVEDRQYSRADEMDRPFIERTVGFWQEGESVASGSYCIKQQPAWVIWKSGRTAEMKTN